VAAFRCDVTAKVDDGKLNRNRYAGAGCHPDRNVALARALTEAAQHRLTRIAGSREDLPSSGYRSPPEKVIARQRQIIIEEPCGCNFTDVPTFDGQTFTDDLEWLLRKVSSAGLDRILVIDLTLPEYSIPVVRVVIPGLEDSVGINDYAFGSRALKARENFL
jgi:ribosomal protein S12 methylthiotransferase accessory factor